MNEIKLQIATLYDMPTVLNMANLYRYDLSEFMAWSVEADGMHRCYGLEDYWKHNNLPFIIYVDNELAGFLLVETFTEDASRDYEIGEFFILRKFRRSGIATKVCLELFDRFKGRWVVSQLAPNKPAIDFWHKILSLYSEDSYETSSMMDDEVGEMIVMRFSN
jgi:predicted acetyltransferase